MRLTGHQSAEERKVPWRGKAIYIHGFVITGGLTGIRVHRMANAVIDTNVIQHTGANGIEVSSLGFAAITNNTMSNNPGDGIVVPETAAANIGFNNITD